MHKSIHVSFILLTLTSCAGQSLKNESGVDFATIECVDAYSMGKVDDFNLGINVINDGGKLKGQVLMMGLGAELMQEWQVRSSPPRRRW